MYSRNGNLVLTDEIKQSIVEFKATHHSFVIGQLYGFLKARHPEVRIEDVSRWMGAHDWIRQTNGRPRGLLKKQGPGARPIQYNRPKPGACATISKCSNSCGAEAMGRLSLQSVGPRPVASSQPGKSKSTNGNGCGAEEMASSSTAQRPVPNSTSGATATTNENCNRAQQSSTGTNGQSTAAAIRHGISCRIIPRVHLQRVNMETINGTGLRVPDATRLALEARRHSAAIPVVNADRNNNQVSAGIPVPNLVPSTGNNPSARNNRTGDRGSGGQSGAGQGAAGQAHAINVPVVQVTGFVPLVQLRQAAGQPTRSTAQTSSRVIRSCSGNSSQADSQPTRSTAQNSGNLSQAGGQPTRSTGQTNSRVVRHVPQAGGQPTRSTGQTNSRVVRHVPQAGGPSSANVVPASEPVAPNGQRSNDDTATQTDGTRDIRNIFEYHTQMYFAVLAVCRFFRSQSSEDLRSAIPGLEHVALLIRRMLERMLLNSSFDDNVGGQDREPRDQA